MEQENLNQTTEEQVKENALFKVTPLSKYVALTLFVALPFIGGWIGYQYSPDKIVEVERIVEVEKTAKDMDATEAITEENIAELTLSEVCARDSNSIRANNGDYILRAEPSSWETQYDIIIKVKDDERKGVLCKYNDTSGGYEYFIDLTNVDDDLMPLDIIKLFADFQVGQNIYLTTSYNEGLQYAPLLKVDVSDIQPKLENTGFWVPNHPGFVTSPSKEKMILFTEDKRHQLYMFDIETGNSILVHEIDPLKYTYFNKDGYGEPRFRVEWLDDETVRVRAVSLEKNEFTENIFVNDEENLTDQDLRETGDLIEKTIKVSDYSF